MLLIIINQTTLITIEMSQLASQEAIAEIHGELRNEYKVVEDIEDVDDDQERNASSQQKQQRRSSRKRKSDANDEDDIEEEQQQQAKRSRKSTDNSSDSKSVQNLIRTLRSSPHSTTAKNTDNAVTNNDIESKAKLEERAKSLAFLNE
jgi:hypothetical protein